MNQQGRQRGQKGERTKHGQTEKRSDDQKAGKNVRMETEKSGGGIRKQIDDILQFRTFITTKLLRSFYAVCTIILISIGVVGMVIGVLRFDPFTLLGFAFWGGGLAVAIIGNLFLRIFFESWLLFFRMHEALSNIEETAQKIDIERKVGNKKGR